MKRSIPDFQQIPDKIYFRIGEVSDLVGVDPHVLRYWETEFTRIKPFRGKSKQRLYRRQDVENLLLIKLLLHDEGYTISGARKLLKGMRRQEPFPEAALEGYSSDQPLKEMHILQQIKIDLESILAELGMPRPIPHK